MNLEDSEFFHYFQKDYNGLTITFRQWKSNGNVDELLDDSFAQASGYDSIDGMIADSNLIDFINQYGYCPTWLRLCVDGRIAAVIDVPSLVSNA